MSTQDEPKITLTIELTMQQYEQWVGQLYRQELQKTASSLDKFLAEAIRVGESQWLAIIALKSAKETT